MGLESLCFLSLSLGKILTPSVRRELLQGFCFQSLVADSAGAPPSPAGAPCSTIYGPCTLGLYPLIQWGTRTCASWEKGTMLMDTKTQDMYRRVQALPMYNEVVKRECAYKTEPRNALQLRNFLTIEPAPNLWKWIPGMGNSRRTIKKMVKPSDSESHSKVGKHI